MIITPHLLIGAAIGLKIKKVGWIIFIGIFSHFVLDKIPHWDYGNGTIKKYQKTKIKRPLMIFFLKLITDGLIGFFIVLFIIWKKDLTSLDYLTFIFIGIFASILPDLILFIGSFFQNKFTTSYSHFHSQVLHCQKHIHKPTLLGVGTQVLVSIIAILILLS